MRLDGLAQQQPQQHGREEADQQYSARSAAPALVGSATTVSRMRCQYTRMTAKMAPVWMAMSKTLALASSKPSSARQDQVAGGGDRRNWSALDHAHDGGLEQQRESTQAS